MTFAYIDAAAFKPEKSEELPKTIEHETRWLLVQILNELRLIRAVQFNLPSPEALDTHHDKDGGK